MVHFDVPSCIATNGVLKKKKKILVLFSRLLKQIFSHSDIMVYMATPGIVGLNLLLLHISCGELNMYIYIYTYTRG